MVKSCAFLLILCVSAHAQFKVQDTSVGTTINLAGTWQFKPQNSDREFAVPVPQMLSRIQWWLDDSDDFKKWEQARLDALGFDVEKTDEGVYRATIEVPQLPKDRQLWIEFDGVAMRCKVSLNGHELGGHEGMFSRFGFDLTPHLKAGQNELTVWVSMEKIPPTDANLGEAVTVNLSAAKVISMSKGMFGPLTPNQDNRAYDLLGIWQPVKLVVRGNAKLDDVWCRASEDRKAAKLDIDISSQGAIGDIKVIARWTDRNPTGQPGSLLGFSADWTWELPSGGLKKNDLPAISPDMPLRLWTPAEPNLYSLEVTLEQDGKVLDRWSHNVGFRTFEVKGNQFLLNGKPYWLRGTNQLPYGKNPWDKDLPRKLIQYLHDGNINSTRTHCTPWNEAWLDAADEIGLALSIEGIRPWAFAGRSDQIGREVMPPDHIFQHWLTENEDVVKRCRNHPSVFMFTVGNEMMLRDANNMKKWGLLSEVTKQTRRLAPDHPIVVSSDYVRDPKFYEETLKPAGIDDGDIDDMHSYAGWYADSPFVVEKTYDKQLKQNAGKRPLIGQEMSSGYPDLDTGLPVMRYTRDLLTPQAWVGTWAFAGSDPAVWLNEHAKVTKRWAETLRYQRGGETAGFSLFSAECWFRHSYLPEAEPYPVYRAVKDAFAPIGLALETAQRRFYEGDEIRTSVYITNDDEHFRDLRKLRLIAAIGRESSVFQQLAEVAELPYYATKKIPVVIKLPRDAAKRRGTDLTLMLKSANWKHISSTTDPIEIFARPVHPRSVPDGVIVVKPGETFSDNQRRRVESGKTAIFFSPGSEIMTIFPDDIVDVRRDVAEFVDWTPVRGTKLAEKLEPMDLKWWARKDDWRVFVGSGSHRIKSGSRARELIRYIPAHGYIAKEKVPEQYRVVMSEIPLGKGRVWIVDLDLEASMEVDPAARLFADNLYRAALHQNSTDDLPDMPCHEDTLEGFKR